MKDPDMDTSHLKRIYLTAKAMARNVVSPELSAKMFFADFFVFPPLIAVCLFVSLDNVNLVSSLSSLSLVGFGFVCWTLAEYLVHRFVFHHFPIFVDLHRAHHDSPRALIGSPTILTALAFYCFAYWPASELEGHNSAASWLAGLMFGYVCYVTVHYLVHQNIGDAFHPIRKLKRQHAIHHHNREGKYNFGVITLFWDRVFGTLAKR
jgi:sterol desaturase/sphingolipid hydroxylase (fatty acid hydroxylase superfamily)